MRILTFPSCFIRPDFFEKARQFFGAKPARIFMLKSVRIQQIADPFNQRRRRFCPPVVGKQFSQIV